MADQLQLRRGTTSQMLTFTGAQGEVVVDTDLNALVVHNGVSAGGFYSATSKQLRDGTFYYNEDVGSVADAYILVPKANTNVPSTYLDGVQFGFVTTHPNTGPATANFQGLGVKNLKYPGGVDPLAGEINGRTYVIYDSANGWLEIQRKASGAPPQLRTVGSSVAGSNLTATLSPCTIDFRSSTLGSGVVNTRNVTSTISVVAPNGATLGTVNASPARIMILAIYGPSNVELALMNLSGSVNLDETTLINTTAISAGSTAANVAYSTVARTNVAFRIVGFIDSTQTTAGAWNTSPSLVQGAGGQAMAAMASFGYGQVPVDVTASRALATNYINTTGKLIWVDITVSSTSSGQVAMIPSVNVPGTGNVSFGQTTYPVGAAGFVFSRTIPVPSGAAYSIATTGSSTTPVLSKWVELR